MCVCMSVYYGYGQMDRMMSCASGHPSIHTYIAYTLNSLPQAPPPKTLKPKP